MKRFFNDWGTLTLVNAVVILFIVWLILGAFGREHSLAANILGIITIILSIAAIGSLWKVQGKPTTDWGKLINASAPLLIALVLGTYFLEREFNIAWFPETIVAYGTLVLAVATYQLGQTTIRENKKLIDENERIRKEERERESIKRRINEVQEWIEGALGIQSKYAIPRMGKLFAEDFRAEALETTSVYAKLEARRLDELIDSLRRKEMIEIVYVDNTLETLVSRIVTLFTTTTVVTTRHLVM